MKIMSVLLILISPYLSLFVSLLGYYYQPLREKLWRFLLITFVFVSGFCINTTYELDIDRYYAILDICKQLSFFEVVNQLADGLILENFMFWFFSHLGVYELMPAFSAATVLGIGTYIAGDSAKRTNNLKFLWLIILFLLLITPIFNLASNVRNVLAFSLITLGTYRDLVQHKRGVMTLFLYIAPCFLHVTGVIISSLRLFIPIIRRFPLFCFCFLGIVSGLINVLHNYMIFINNFEGVIGTIVKRLLFKAFNYMEGASVYSQLMLNSVFDQINRPLTFFTAIIISYFSIKLIRDRYNNRYREFATYCLMLSIIVLSCAIFAVPAYWRFAVAMIISFSLVFCVTLQERKIMGKLDRFLFLCLGIVAIVKFAITFPYLSSRMDLIQYFFDTSLTNIYFIFIKTVYSVI